MSDAITTPKAETKPLTPADVDAAVQAALAKYKADSEAAVKAKEDDAEKKRLEAEGEWKKLLEKEREETAKERKEREKAEKIAAREAARTKVASELKLKSELAADLAGDTEEELKADYARQVERTKKWSEAAGLKVAKSAGAPGPVAQGTTVTISSTEIIKKKADEIRAKQGRAV